VFAAIAGEPIAPEFRRDVSMYWTIVLLDLGIVVPATIAGAIGILREASWSQKALYTIFGWFALVPPSVAAMSIVMVGRGDPNAALGQAVVLSVAAVGFAALAIRLYAPLFRIGHASRQGSLSGPADEYSDPVVVREERAPAAAEGG
jgi:hypothetical protein